MSRKYRLLVTVAAAALCAGVSAQAQEAEGDAAAPDADAALTADKIVVIGRIPYRNRSEETEPILEYDSEFFQRFEPLTAGDALRRVPSVTFLSDVIESDAPQLRGLAPGFTQILINGERVPGAEADRSFFLDRIPAELIERVEIIRSSSARRTGDAVAGSINIVLRDGFDLDGGYVRGGGLRFDDGELKPSLGAVWGGDVLGGNAIFGANLQGRYNPKQKFSRRFGDGPENNPNFRTEEFDNREDQSDVRDGTDYSFNGRWTREFANDSELEIGGFLTFTDREERERSFEYDDPTAITGPVPDGNLLTDNQQLQDIDQLSYVVDGSFEVPALGGLLDLRVSFASFEEDRTDDEDEIDFEDLEVGQERELLDISDRELTFELAQAWELREGLSFEVGAYFQEKTRDTSVLTGENEIDFSGPWDQFSDRPFQLRTGDPSVGFEPGTGAVSEIRENRADIYGVFNGTHGRLAWEAGIRYETTDTTIIDQTTATPTSQENDYDFVLPSASLRFDLSGVDRINASAARTVRRPDFESILPVLLEGEIEDDDFRGNPDLEPESSWGFDIGYERRIFSTGIVGVNFFYRTVENLIELQTTGEEGSEGPGSLVFQPQNTGDGEVYGIEVDLSTPLTIIGLPDTGLFANYAYLDSEIEDFFGTRRFNNQSDFVYNVGFIHQFRQWGTAFGMNYRQQGEAFERVIAEEVTTTYGADLEVFVEQSLFDRVTVRFVAANLLNASKDEAFNKFDSLADQFARDFDEFELETEEAGPVFQLIARVAF